MNQTIMQNLLKLSFLLLVLNNLFAQSGERIFYLGHSLVNFNVPNMTEKLAQAAGQAQYYQANIGNGASLSWHWTSPTTGEGDRWDTTLRNQSFGHFILTEAIALKPNIMYNNSYGYLDSFYNYAARKSPNHKMYIYETWHCINSGLPQGCEWDNESNIPWRTRLNNDLALWEGMADHINKRIPNTCYMIPGGQGMAKLHDEINAGRFPGFSSSRDLFTDNIHLTDIGNYFIACIMYSVIHKKSPLGLPNRLTNPWGQLYAVFPTPLQAQILQKIAWETVCSYKRTNTNCNATESQNLEISDIKIFPNPTEDLLNIQSDQPIQKVDVFTIDGIKAGSYSCTHGQINISNLLSGVYILKVGQKMFRVIKS